MSREERKLRKAMQERAKREFQKSRKLQGRQKRGGSRPTLAGTIAEIGPGYCDIISGRDRIRCRGFSDLAIGDQVLYSLERRRVEEILPRRTALSRSDPHNPRIERVIAANVDIVVNVVALKSPPLRPGLIDRYLIATGKSGAAPLLCVNKMDLLDTGEDLEPLAPYWEVVPIFLCSAATGVGLAALLAALEGKICVFSGHSGVGKSSLLNALDPQLQLATNDLSAANERGRHTTTGSAVYQLSNGAIVIDTPGIREFGLWDISASDLALYFQEFNGFQCAFADCTHDHEPGCGVKAAVEAGEIAASRYQSYLRILNAL